MDTALRQAVAHHQAGRLQEAERLYRAILQAQPYQPDANHNLGVLAGQSGRHEAGLPYLRTALAANPAQGQYSLSYAEALLATGHAGEALNIIQAAMQRGFNTAAARVLLQKAGEAVNARPPLTPSSPQSLPQSECNQLVALFNAGRHEELVSRTCLLIEQRPDSGFAWNMLGSTLMAQGKDALPALQKATELLPNNAGIHFNLGIALNGLGQIEDAAANFRRALEIKPDYAEAHSNLLFCLTHQEAMPPAALFAEHVAFGEYFEAICRRHRSAHDNLTDPSRRLRLGFVSGDLRNHSVASFIAPVWAALDPAQVEIWAYSNHVCEDQISGQLRALSHAWRQVARMSDDELAAQIRADGIDVLFDLSGHTAHNRLLTFARKPAPLQVTWIGYPNTSGLRAMDYVLCDRFNAPHGLYEHWYVEKFARLPSSSAFAPAMEAPPLNALPALGNGHVTFGSFNRTSKLGSQVIAAWSRVLQAVAGSRLLLGGISDPAQAQQLTELFARHGIEAERLAFRPRVPLRDYLALHHEVDIVLDTWPYTGGTTTNHALWMGVPVVTLLGPSRAHCVSAAIMAGRLGLEGWVARDVEEFVRIAVQWANSPQELAQLRAGMRERWQVAPLRQPATVARGLEKAVRVMWQRWSAGLPAEHFEIGLDEVF